jgi:hypothetical protein
MKSIFNKLFTPKVSDKSDNKRLERTDNEPALREGTNFRRVLGEASSLQDVLDAKEYLFNETVELTKIEKK